jgi:LCP family protein required for cell wall assembly
VALTSIPRDVMVQVADTGERSRINSAFARDEGGPQNLIDTIKQNFDVTVNHYIQVEFESFPKVVDAIGGVPIWVPQAARDRSSGFYTDAHRQCVTLNGQEGLEFVRSRKMEIQVDGEWTQELQSDVHRVERQKIFVQRAMTDALAEVRSNPLRITQLIDIGVEHVTLDENLGIGDLRELAESFKGFDAGNLESYALPVLEDPLNPRATLVVDEAAAEPMLNVFRGLPPGEIRPQLVEVQVLNGTVAGDEARVVEGLAGDVGGALDEVGFDLLVPGDAPSFHEQTTIEYAPGNKVFAQRLARHITSDVAVPLQEAGDLPDGQVRLIAGADFTTVHEAPTPPEDMPGAAAAGDATGATGSGGESEGGTGGSASSGESGSSSGGGSSPTTTAPPATTTTVDPYIIGVPPEGKTC